MTLVMFSMTLMLTSSIVSAHQPRLVMGWDINSEQNALLIPEPEISKAYYGELNGKPDYYKIILDKQTPVYLGILSPYVPGASTDFTVELYDYKDNFSMTQVILLDGKSYQWKPMYEPFGGDWYLQGPDAKENLTNVTYYIKVSSPSNTGKYSFAIGDIESFPPQEALNAYIALPMLKQLFFERHVLFNFLHFLGIILAMGAAFVASAMLLSTERLRIRSIPYFYHKARSMGWAGFLLAGATLIYALIQSPANLLAMLRAGVFLLLFLLFLYANHRAHRLEDNSVPGTLKAAMWLSIILWSGFLLLTVALL
jgi:hypothetical protein